MEPISSTRVLVPPLERRTAANLVGMPGVPAGTSSAMSDLWSNMSDGRVAVLLPFAPPVGFPPKQGPHVADMVRCEVHPTGFNQVSADTYYATYGLTRGDYAGICLHCHEPTRQASGQRSGRSLSR